MMLTFTDLKPFDPLKTKNPQTGVLINNGDPDQMLHKVEFYQEYGKIYPQRNNEIIHCGP